MGTPFWSLVDEVVGNALLGTQAGTVETHGFATHVGKNLPTSIKVQDMGPVVFVAYFFKNETLGFSTSGIFFCRMIAIDQVGVKICGPFRIGMGVEQAKQLRELLSVHGSPLSLLVYLIF